MEKRAPFDGVALYPATYKNKPTDKIGRPFSKESYRLEDFDDAIADLQAMRAGKEKPRYLKHNFLHSYVDPVGKENRVDWFDDFVTPYLADLIRGYRSQGGYVIKHTDGNIMPILDRLLLGEPHALHSLDPQGGVDIAEVKRLVGDRVCLIGNVNCGLLDTGTEAECVASARYALKHGMPGGRYIFSTSNCIYTGMRLARYELILDVWRREGKYPN